jgi:hypothetical protein
MAAPSTVPTEWSGRMDPGRRLRRCSVAGRIRDEDVAMVRDRTAIADVVSEFVTLKAAGGGNVKGLCPFFNNLLKNINKFKYLYRSCI